MAIGKDFPELMKKIGYEFFDCARLENALTHSSYSNEYKSKGLKYPSNERLEFLGDAVLELTVSEYLYHNYKDVGEGKLTKIRQHLVCEKTLAKVASELCLGDYINLGKGEENDCRTRPKVLADTMEAVIAAIYIDARSNNSEKYRDVIINLFKNEFITAETSANRDYKTLLQQFIEKDGMSTLEYEVVAESGPDHKKEFSVVAKVNNNVVGKGVAGKIKDAESEAAKKALSLFGINL